MNSRHVEVMICRVELSAAAARELGKLQKKIRERIAGRIDRLTRNPRGPGTAKLAGTDDGYRVRIGDYRVLYQIRDSDKVVLIVKVGHRREVYRR
jgi:mRNA interferase RelE/StbE